ncbi:MAG: (Fe-S)-binding protein [Deltaproteobacteria bacterium]|nr:(Fe-S)-binding protein [Deltaproteobacteria bacterium]
MKSPLHLAKAHDLPAIGIEPMREGTDGEQLVSALGELRASTRSLAVMLDTCTKCGNCAEQCHSYLGTEDPFNIPAARADLMRRVYKRHFTAGGKVLGGFTGARDVDGETIERWLTYFYQCNECRRCAVFCPFGIDTAEITIAARHILSRLGIVPKFMQGIAANLQATGNNMGIGKPALLDSARFLEEEMKEETGLDIRIPVDEPGSDILYVPSSADFFTNVDTIIGAAKVFHVLGANWTVSSSALEAANFGLLFNLSIMRQHGQRLAAAAQAVGASMVVHGECGHGWRAARMCAEGAEGPAPFRLVHVLEYVCDSLSRLPLRKLPLRVTLHDPCNYARAGGIVEQPRAILRACVEEFVEMSPNGRENFCCGGGSGLLMDEMLDVRLRLGKKKAEQVAAVGQLDYLAIPCSICKAQLPPVMKHYGMPALEMGGVIDLVGKALNLGGNRT